MMEAASLVFEILGFAATIALTVGIFIFEWRQAKQKDKRDVAQAARQFIYDNFEDVSFFALCEVAANVNPTEKHERKIYNKYNVLTRKTQLKVLSLQKVLLKLPEDENWADEYLKKWKEDAVKLKLVSEDYCFLDEDVKCFHNAFEDYGKIEVRKDDIGMDDYTKYWLEREKFKDKISEDAWSPIDYSNMNNRQKQKNTPAFARGMVEIISRSSRFIYNTKEHDGSAESVKQSATHDMKSFVGMNWEDKYYGALLDLYFAYCVIKPPYKKRFMSYVKAKIQQLFIYKLIVLKN